jgi:hypothetical protein
LASSEKSRDMLLSVFFSRTHMHTKLWALQLLQLYSNKPVFVSYEEIWSWPEKGSDSWSLVLESDTLTSRQVDKWVDRKTYRIIRITNRETRKYTRYWKTRKHNWRSSDKNVLHYHGERGHLGTELDVRFYVPRWNRVYC